MKDRRWEGEPNQRMESQLNIQPQPFVNKGLSNRIQGGGGGGGGGGVGGGEAGGGGGGGGGCVLVLKVQGVSAMG